VTHGGEPRSVLVIRRDNIGDLVCTTPLIAALRGHYPQATIGVLANSYNAPVLEGNSDLDDVYAYDKLKHIGGQASRVIALIERFGLIWKLRQSKLDLIVLPGGTNDFRAARLSVMLSPRRIVFSNEIEQGEHEVERAFSAARKLGIKGPIPALRVVASPDAVTGVKGEIDRAFPGLPGPMVALHISARRPKQRWPADRFAQLAVCLHEQHGAKCMLLWSPGSETHAQHPGDDEKAKLILELTSGQVPLIARPTPSLRELTASLATCQTVICSDGGAMHIAAGLGKPIVCFFGDSPVERWHPWQVPHVVLKPQNGQVAELAVQQVVEAFTRLPTKP
jgi:heptosyltransferase-3